MTPGLVRIFPPRTRANTSRARPSGVFAQTISARAHSNPAQPPQAAFLHKRIQSLHARTPGPAANGRLPLLAGTSEPTDPTRQNKPEHQPPGIFTNDFRPRTREPRPATAALARRPIQPVSRTPEPGCRSRRRLCTNEPIPSPDQPIPEPARIPSARTNPPTATQARPSAHGKTHERFPTHARRHSDAASPAALGLRSGVRLAAAPAPPSANLPESRYHPVNATLDSTAGSWHA